MIVGKSRMVNVGKHFLCSSINSFSGSSWLCFPPLKFNLWAKQFEDAQGILKLVNYEP